MNLKTIFPNSIKGQDIDGASYVYDKNKALMGFVDEDDIFWIREDYEYWQSALLRLIENDVKVMKWECTDEYKQKA